ncbi:MAG: sulfotransferase [Balneolales bacterium]
MTNSPDFIIGGAAKSGTTSLSRYLNAHSEIFLPHSELNFFPFCEKQPDYDVLQRPIVSDFQIYSSYYHESNARVKGEKSVSYLYKGLYRQTIHNILKYHPSGKKVKMIFLLRDPIDRAWSQYMHNLNIYESLPFQQAIEAWPDRANKKWVPAFDYLGAGLYYESLSSYFNHFDQVKVYLFESLKTNADWLLQDVFDFLEVENEQLTNSTIRYNTSQIPNGNTSRLCYNTLFHNPVAQGLKKTLSNENQVRVKDFITSFSHHKPALPEETRQQFLPWFRDDIEKLQGLIQRDLGKWLI